MRFSRAARDFLPTRANIVCLSALIDERFSWRESCARVGRFALFIVCSVGFVPTYLPTNIYLTTVIEIFMFIF